MDPQLVPAVHAMRTFVDGAWLWWECPLFVLLQPMHTDCLMCGIDEAPNLLLPAPPMALLEGEGASGQSQSGCRAVTEDVKAVGGGRFLAVGNAVGAGVGVWECLSGIDPGQWGGGSPPPPSSDSLPPPPLPPPTRGVLKNPTFFFVKYSS